jgi:hypothetical protein
MIKNTGDHTMSNTNASHPDNNTFLANECETDEYPIDTLFVTCPACEGKVECFEELCIAGEMFKEDAKEWRSANGCTDDMPIFD